MSLKFLSFYLILSVLTSSYSHAEIILDGTLAPATELMGPHYEITNNLGQQVGTNLFHSFSHFNLAEGESANYSAPAEVNISNIINRVTGGQPSSINGEISSSIPNANFYFLNPAGIMFGNGASINVPGSFHLSTADTLRLGSDGQFNAKFPEQTVLSVAPPSAFGFLTELPAPITVQNTALSVAPDQTLSLIGGDLTIKSESSFDFFAFNPYKPRPPEVQDSIAGVAQKQRPAGLYAEGGRINIASVASVGEVTPTDTGLEFSSNLRGGNIKVDGLPITVTTVTSEQKGGKLFIRGGRFELDDAGVLAETLGAQQGGTLDIQVDNLTLREGSIISTSTKSVGEGGDAHITVSETLNIVGVKAGQFLRNSGIYSSADGRSEEAAGKAGNIYLQARHLNLTGGGQIGSGSFGSGDGGIIFIVADTVTIAGQYHDDNNNEEYRSGIYGSSEGGREFSKPKQDGSGGGQLLPNPDHIETGLVAEGNGGQAGTNNDQQGNPSVNATEVPMPITGEVTENAPADQVVNYYYPNTGNAGSVQITARQVSLDGGVISTDTKAQGNGGKVTINAQQLSLNHGAYIASGTLGSGQSGSIEIVTNDLTLLDRSQIFGNSTSPKNDAGAAGEITIQANQVRLIQGSKINTSAHRAAGGKVILNLSDSLYLQRGQITTSVMGGKERGGDIVISNPQFVILNHAMIRAQADEGQGGDIQIKSSQLLRSTDSIITASSRLGINGHITISSPDESISNSLQLLPVSFFKDVSSLLLNKICRPTGEKVNTLLVIPLAGSWPLPQDLKPSSVLALSAKPSNSSVKPGQSVSTSTAVLTKPRDNSLLALVGCSQQRVDNLLKVVNSGVGN